MFGSSNKTIIDKAYDKRKIRDARKQMEDART